MPIIIEASDLKHWKGPKRKHFGKLFSIGMKIIGASEEHPVKKLRGRGCGIVILDDYDIRPEK